MRIIAGQAKGRTILSIPKKFEGVRPISARIRQSLFDILRPKVPGSLFLDLFAGTGAVGLEALSRGARRVVFIEKEGTCLKVIEKNVERMGFAAKATALKGDAVSPLKWILHHGDGAKFDLIFMGPPYKTAEKAPLALARPALQRVMEAGLLAPTGWIVVQHHQKEEPGALEGLEQFRREKYGDTRVTFYRYPGTEIVHELVG